MANRNTTRRRRELAAEVGKLRQARRTAEKERAAEKARVTEAAAERSAC
jgi:hypothetical protein